MLGTIIIIAIAIGLIALFLKMAMGSFQSGTGGSTNIVFGATQELLTHDQRKAMEIVVKKQLGDKEEDQTSGEPVNDDKEILK